MFLNWSANPVLISILLKFFTSLLLMFIYVHINIKKKLKISSLYVLVSDTETSDTEANLSSLASLKTPKCTRNSESSTCDSAAENGMEKENMQPPEKINSECSFNSFTIYP